jgi:hypothetical protein
VQSLNAPESHALSVRDPTTCDMEYCFDAREIQKAAGAFFVGEAIEYMYIEAKSASPDSTETAASAKGIKILGEEPNEERENVHGATNQIREKCAATTVPTTATNINKGETPSNGSKGAPVDPFLRRGGSKTNNKTPKSPWIITGRGLQKPKIHSTKTSTAE